MNSIIETNSLVKTTICQTNLTLWDLPEEERTLKEHVKKDSSVTIDLGELPGDLPEGFDTERFLQYARHGAILSTPDVHNRTGGRGAEIWRTIFEEVGSINGQSFEAARPVHYGVDAVDMTTFRNQSPRLEPLEEDLLTQLDRLSGLTQTTENTQQDEF